MGFEHLDLLNSNSLRSYPIKEGLTKLSVDGAFTIPDDFIVEFIISATSDPTARFYISKITNLQDSIIVELTESSDTVPAGYFTISIPAHTLYKDYYFTAINDYIGANGKLTIAYLTTMQALPSGVFNFALDTTEMETKTIIPCMSTLNSLTFVDSVSGLTQTMTGRVNISARTNLRFTSATVDTTNDSIILDAGDGLGLNTKCDNTQPCIKTINSVPPDDVGNFTLTVADCANLSPLSSNSGLMLSDTCCKPCMGCDEVSELTDRLMQLETDVLKLRDLYSNLQTLITEFSNTMNFTCSC